MADVPITNPPDGWGQLAADAVQQAVRGAPQLCGRFRVPARGQESSEHLETPRNATCVLEFVASRQRFGCLTTGAIEIASDDTEASGHGQNNAKTPCVPRTAARVNRLFIELLRPLMLAIRERDIPKNHQRAAALHDLIAGVRGVQSIQRSRARPVEVVTLVRRERLHEQREREHPRILAGQRQRLRRARGCLDLSSLKMIHVAQADERDGSETCWCVYANSERSLEPETAFLEQAALGPKPEQR